MKLLIAVPAYNEEAAIESTIVRCLEAKERLPRHGTVSEVEITVVSDGSTDRTVELARRHEGPIRLIVFERNRGYGAAIKEAWSRSDAELLGFLDADGTCDPMFFEDLCAALERERAGVALGSRLSPASKMPPVRRMGNVLYALLLSAFARVPVRDTASGMRVVRRDVLAGLLPLPDGLQFTPAMTARALMSGGVKLVEIEMPYREREGQSKLKVGKDGLRFLKAILDMVFLYRPWRPLTLLALLSLALAVALMTMPAEYYLAHRSVQEWMIYRFIVSHLAGTNAVLMLSAAYISERIVRIALGRGSLRDPVTAFFASGAFWAVPAALMTAGLLLVMPSLIELVRTGATYEHWSRFIAMSFCFSTALILIATKAVHYVLELLNEHLEHRPAPGGALRSNR
ncbi:MAG: glycosyltransferase family 2 protein [Acidobacteriota bacterium]